MTPMKSLLLATSALLASTMLQSPVRSAPLHAGALAVAQNAPGGHGENAEQKNEKKKKEHPRHERGPAPHRPAAAPPSHPKPPVAAHPKPPTRPQPPHPAQAAPPRNTPPAGNRAQPAPKPEHKSEQKPPQRRPAATPQAAPSRQAEPERHERRRGQNRREEHERQRSNGPNRGPREGTPAPQSKPAAPQPSHQPAQNKAAPPQPKQPAENKSRPQQQPKQPAQNNAAPQAPANATRIVPPSAAPQQPVKPHDAREFIRQRNGKPERTIQDVRKERRTTRENGRVFIHEGDRTIVRENNRTFIRHNEDQRFAIGARNVHVDHRGNEVHTVIVRPNGIRIVNVTRDGRLVRRIRRDRNGHEVVIIDNRDIGPRRDIFVDLPPPRIRIPRDRYIVEVDRASPTIIYDTLVAPPVVPIEQDYTLAQVRYSESLRERMPRLDLDIHFDTGSWQLTPDQMDKLSAVAQALNRAIDNNPREVYLIEGHTDAVGSEEDNLSLSDRRAEAVAVALTEQFHVPPENLVTQGYGEQGLKVQTQGASRANRRVAIRRITPLIDRTAQR